jgi:hypothetical protein
LNSPAMIFQSSTVLSCMSRNVARASMSVSLKRK